jgi:transposase
MKKQRKNYTPEEKVAILRRHLVEGVPISDLDDELGLQPTVFYRWQKDFFENGAAAFQQRGRTNHQSEQERITYLEQKDMLAGHQQEIQADRDRKLESAREPRKNRRRRAA